MKGGSGYAAAAVLLVSLCGPAAAAGFVAEGEAMPGAEGGAGHGQHQAAAQGGGVPQPQGSALGLNWRAALTDDQKGEIDWMHLRLRQEQRVIDAQIALKEAELDRLVMSENADVDSLLPKVDELMQLKRERLLNHYRHLLEMRQVLTPQQRVSFDLDVLSARHHESGWD